MNKNDSERVRGVLESMGLSESIRARGSDVIVINTCSIRQKAEDRVYGHMKKFAEFKKEKPDMVLAVTGCMPGRDVKGIFREKMPAVDFYFPIKELPQFPRWLSGVRPDIVNTADEKEDYLKIQPSRRTNTFQSFVSISGGCDNYCTFCVVPFSRGRMYSRSLSETLQEVREAVTHGAIDVMLVGQNVNTYSPADIASKSALNPFHDGFAVLLWEMNQIADLKRIHFIAANPQDMSNEVIDALGLPKHVNYLHLPVQAGSDRVLKKMNRRYTREQYFEIIDKVKTIRPTIALGTDIIVGFCTETEEEFMETIDLYKRVGFDISYNAQYSSRSGTVAGRLWKDDVPREEKKRRWEYLQDVMEEQTLVKNQAYRGQTVEVLVEKYLPFKKICVGNSREIKIVEFPGTVEMVGTIVKVRVDEALTWVLRGSKV